MHRGIAQVAIGQQDPLAHAGEVERHRIGRCGLAFARARTGDQHGRGRTVRGRELQRRPERVIGLGEGRADVGQGFAGGRPAREQGNDTQNRHAQLALDVLRSGQGFVEGLKDQGDAQTKGEAKEDGEQHVHKQAGLGRTVRRFGDIDDRDVVRGHAARDADFLVTLQEAVIELTVGVHLALQDVVLDRALTQVQDVALEPVHAALKRRLLVGGNLKLVADRVANAVRDAGDLRVEFVNARFQLQHFGEVRLVDAELLFVLGLNPRALFREALDRAVFQDFGKIHDRRGLGLAPLLLGADAGGGRLSEGGIEGRQIAGDQRLGLGAVFTDFADVDDLLIGRVGHKLTLALFQTALGLGEALLEEVPRILGRLEFALEVGLDEILGEGVRQTRGQDRIRAVKADRHQARAADGRDAQSAGGESHGGLAPRGGVLGGRPFPDRRGPAHLLDELVRGRQTQGVDHPLGQRSAAQQAVLGFEELLAGADVVARSHVFRRKNPRSFAVDLNGGRRGVDRGHQQGRDRRQDHGRQDHADDEEAVLDGHPPVGGQVDAELPAHALRGRSTGRAIPIRGYREAAARRETITEHERLIHFFCDAVRHRRRRQNLDLARHPTFGRRGVREKSDVQPGAPRPCRGTSAGGQGAGGGAPPTDL